MMKIGTEIRIVIFDKAITAVNGIELILIDIRTPANIHALI